MLKKDIPLQLQTSHIKANTYVSTSYRIALGALDVVGTAGLVLDERLDAAEVELVVAEGEADEVRVAVVLAEGGRQLQVADRAVLPGLGLRRKW